MNHSDITDLYQKYHVKLSALANALVRRMGLARLMGEDLVQMTFLIALPHVEKGVTAGKTDQEVWKWLRSIIRSRAIDEWRRQQIVVWEPLAEGIDIIGGETDDPLAVAVRDDLRARMRACLPFLVPEYRRLLVWRYWEDLSNAEIAALTGEKLKAIKSKMLRARAAFKRVFLEGRVTFVEARTYLNQSGKMLRRYIADGRLPALRIDERKGQYLITCEALQRFASTNPRRNKKSVDA